MPEWLNGPVSSGHPIRSSDRTDRPRRMMGPDAQSNDLGENKNMYYVYFLLLSNRDIYKGSCSDLTARIKDHEVGKVQSTRNYRPFKLIGYEAYLLKSDAQRRERFLKTTEGRRLLNQQYRDIINKMRNNGEVA